mgnify:FL=1
MKNLTSSSTAPLDHDALSVVLVTAGYDHTIRFWEAWSGLCSHTIQYSDSQVNRLAISPNKRLLAVAGHGVVRLYDCNASGTSISHHDAAGRGINVAPLSTFEGHTGNVTSIAWHCDGKWLVSGGEDGTLKIWDTRTSRAQRVYDHKAPVNDVVIHPNQGELASCDQNGSVKIWDLGENGCSHELVPEEEVPMRSVSIASDGSCLVAANNKGRVFVWKMQSGITDDEQMERTELQPVTKFQAHDTYITRCALSPVSYTHL